ncbi:MAG: nucleotidyltransferase domain-containing protein [Nanoarchaeota archaeon]|nr:nucleotidyltransferase domain-containing protein [Nanoarchaeota archaeon]
MIYEQEMKIIGLYRNSPFKEFTLQEIMKALGKRSYSWAYTAAKKLEKEGIINIRTAGKTILCSFNLSSAKAIANIAYAEKLACISRAPMQLAEKIIASLSKCTPFFIIIIGGSYAAGTVKKSSDMDIAIIVENEDIKRQIKPYLKDAVELSEVNIDEHFFTRDELREMLIRQEENFGKELAGKHIIAFGADSYYSIIKEAHKNGFQG